jgi:putative FmdB family regulatory protein
VPIYEYRCDDCGVSHEIFQKMSDQPLEKCEACGGVLRKVLHPVAIHFKGSGFYTTDYGRGKRRPASGGDSSTAEASGSGGGGSEDGGASSGGDEASPATSAASSADGGTSKDKQKST